MPDNASARTRRLNAASKRARRADPARWGKITLPKIRERALAKGLEFDITADDLVVPETCPVLGLRIAPGNGRSDNSPSVDRFDNTRGYTRDNIRVISLRANILKRDATADELRKVLAYMEGKR